MKRKTLVLDLDETLIHSHHDGYEMPFYTFQYPKLHNELLECGVKLCSCLYKCFFQLQCIYIVKIYHASEYYFLHALIG